MDQHLIFDFGPGLVTVLIALIAAVPATLAAYYGYANGRKIDNGNSELAARLARIAAAKQADAVLTPAHIADLDKKE